MAIGRENLMDTGGQVGTMMTRAQALNSEEDEMPKRRDIFLSYCGADDERADDIQEALCKRGLHVWRDRKSISGGVFWADAIETAIRASRGVVVLVTSASIKSDWVAYEYALARGAGIPVIAVVTAETKVPKPIQNFQVVHYTEVSELAEKIDSGLRKQSRATGQGRAPSPRLMARFHEEHGGVCHASDGDPPELCMDLWVEHAPRETRRVSFEIADLGVKRRKWKIDRKKQPHDSHREFLANDLELYGDVEIWAYGISGRRVIWRTRSMLHEALEHWYSGQRQGKEIREALSQIKNN
jgi:hypothetical protein